MIFIMRYRLIVGGWITHKRGIQMKNKTVNCILILMTIIALLSSTSGVNAQVSPARHPECSGDPNAPCYAKISKQTVTPIFSTQTLDSYQWYQGTCGVDVYNNANVKVASLTSYFTVGWDDLARMELGSVSHSTWTLNIFYSWDNLSDEIDDSGPYADGKTYGTVEYVGGSWHRYEVYQHVINLFPGEFSCGYNQIF